MIELRGQSVERTVKVRVSRCRPGRRGSTGAAPGPFVRAARPRPLELASALLEARPGVRARGGGSWVLLAARRAPSPSPEGTVVHSHAPSLAPRWPQGPGLQAGRRWGDPSLR